MIAANDLLKEGPIIVESVSKINRRNEVGVRDPSVVPSISSPRYA